MKKTTKTQKARLMLSKSTIQNLGAVAGGMMNLNPRTDCICCKACATNAC